MSDYLRRIYNRIERSFDRTALVHEMRIDRELRGAATLERASFAFAQILPIVTELDRSCRLKMIVAPQGVDRSGATFRWEFLFDLVRRRAKADAVWFLRWDDSSDAFKEARAQIVARPFAPSGSTLHRMVEEGKLLYPQLKGLWRQEHCRSAALPHTFCDSDRAMQALTRQGLDAEDMEFSLSTAVSAGGRFEWVARTRTQTYSTDFAPPT
jgi:hypothetical protein